jgi:hypothetical protein
VLGIDHAYHGLGSGGSGGGASASSSSASSSSGSGGGCPQGEVMQGGTCVVPCDAGTTQCDGGCVDTATDPANCGACGKRCSADKICAGSACVPPHCTGPLTFATAAQYSAAAIPDTFAIADLNGDARPDLVVATSTYNLMGGTSEILVLLNKGDGSFDVGVAYPLQHDATVGVGDLDGDGKPEIVVTNASTTTVTVLHNQGDGTFTAEPPLTLAAAAGAISVGDVNGDGHADLYWFTKPTFNVLLNQGSGTFLPTVATVPFTTASMLDAADLNGDGIIDVAFATAGTSVYVALNKGDGTFLQSALYFAMASVTGLSFVDWNGDGKPDILAAGTPDTVLLNGGTGTFATQFALTSPPSFERVADMNGDGKADLVGLVSTATADSVNVWLNDGNNTFTTLVGTTVARYASEVHVGDLNGDGLLDMVTLSVPTSHTGTLSVVLNTCPH